MFVNKIVVVILIVINHFKAIKTVKIKNSKLKEIYKYVMNKNLLRIFQTKIKFMITLLMI